MELSIIRDGKRFPYSLRELKKDNPSVSFPKDISKEDLSPYGVIVENVSGDVAELPKRAPKEHSRVAMHQFRWGVRVFGLHVQFERYVLALEGHARDYWFSAPFVTRSSTYVKHFQQFFQLKDSDLDAIFETAYGIEE